MPNAQILPRPFPPERKLLLHTLAPLRPLEARRLFHGSQMWPCNAAKGGAKNILLKLQQDFVKRASTHARIVRSLRRQRMAPVLTYRALRIRSTTLPASASPDFLGLCVGQRPLEPGRGHVSLKPALQMRSIPRPVFVELVLTGLPDGTRISKDGLESARRAPMGSLTRPDLEAASAALCVTQISKLRWPGANRPRTGCVPANQGFDQTKANVKSVRNGPGRLSRTRALLVTLTVKLA